MANSANYGLSIPYEIGRYIASLVPHLDADIYGDVWAEYKVPFLDGPNPRARQMRQGLILEVVNHSSKVQSIFTEYGIWRVLGRSSGSFAEIFAIVQHALNLRKIEELSDPYISYWAVQSWRGEALKEPLFANKEAAEFKSVEQARFAYFKFKQALQVH